MESGLVVVKKSIKQNVQSRIVSTTKLKVIDWKHADNMNELKVRSMQILE